MYRILPSRIDARRGIDISITERVSIFPSKCLFCSANALFNVTDLNHPISIMELRVCASPVCCARAFSQILQTGYGYSPEGSHVPSFVHAHQEPSL